MQSTNDKRRRMTNKKVGKKNTRITLRANQKKEFFDVLERLGHWNVSARAYSREYNIPAATLDKWKQAYVDERGKFQMERVGKELSLMSYSALKNVGKLMATLEKKKIVQMPVVDEVIENGKKVKKTKIVEVEVEYSVLEKIKAAEALAILSEKFTTLQESYGYKAKVADKVENLNFNLNAPLTKEESDDLLRLYEDHKDKEDKA